MSNQEFWWLLEDNKADIFPLYFTFDYTSETTVFTKEASRAARFPNKSAAWVAMGAWQNSKFYNTYIWKPEPVEHCFINVAPDDAATNNKYGPEKCINDGALTTLIFPEPNSSLKTASDFVLVPRIPTRIMWQSAIYAICALYRGDGGWCGTEAAKEQAYITWRAMLSATSAETDSKP